MSHYKNESGRKLPKALCRFVKILPTGPHVTFGSGCIVLQSGPPPSADLITTTQVLSKNDLLGDSSIFVQFEDNQWFELKLKSQDAVNLPDSKSGRVLGHIEGNEDQVSFLRIPVDMFDSRIWPIRKIWPLKKRALSCFYPSDENLETSISNKNITCYVISEDRKDRGFYITEPSYLSFGTDTHEFALLSVSDTDCASPAKTFKDFAKEEKPKGAPLLDAEGRLVGMLAVANSGERKVYPVFLPTLTGDSSTDGPRDKKISNTYMMPIQNKIFKTGPDEEEQHNNHSPKNPPSKELRNEDKGAQTSTMDRQGSASPPSSPLHESSPEANLEKVSAQEQLKDQQQNESGSSHRPNNGEETSSGEVERNSSAEMANKNQPHDDPSTSSLPKDNSAPKQHKYQEQDESVSSQRPKIREESSSEEDENSSSAEVENHGQQQVDPRSASLQEDGEKGSPEETENSSIKSEREEDSASMLEEKDQEGGCAGHGHANNEFSLQDEPDGKSRGKDSMVDSYINENVSQNRIPRIASQNSYHGQLSERGFFLENEDASHPKTVSDTTFPKHNPTFPERHSNSYRRMDTVEVSTEKKHLSSEVSDAVLNNIYVMDHLKQHLDTSVKGIENWRYLAEANKVSIDKQRQWELGEHYSRSEKMFETLKARNPDLLMTSLVGQLRALQIIRVKKYIEDLHLKKDMTVEEFFESPNRNNTGKVLLMLDLIDKEKWWNLGIKIGVDDKSLTQIVTDCVNRQENPGGDVLHIISTSKATMTIGQFKKKLEKIGRSDIAKKLKKLSEKSMIGNLLKDLTLAREVATMLNIPNNSVLTNYKDLAVECEISWETCESLQPPSADSPTQKTIEDIVQRKPEYTVEELFLNLRDMKRLDVIEAISPYFEKKDVLAWKRKWRITSE